MRWFDDLWLKEGFAQYMAYKAMADIKPETNPWKHFNEDIKPLAYAIDETQGTTPIFQDIPNLKDAKSAYGAIVYQKAPAVLKQLNFKLGDAPFRQGLRLYLAQHAYANATWPDLIGAFEQAGAKDLKPWAEAWITRRGMPQIDTTFTCAAGKLTSLSLTQHDILPDGYTWPISNEVLLSATGAEAHIRVDWSTPSTQVQPAIGKPCPNFIFANSGDEAYGRFLLDPGSLKAVLKVDGGVDVEDFFGDNPLRTRDPFLRSLLWNAFWEEVRTAKLDPQTYVYWAKQAISIEEDESISKTVGSHATTALHSYVVNRDMQNELVATIEAALSDRMLHAPTLGLRIVNFHTFTSIAETRHALDELKRLLQDPNAQIPGLTLQPRDRWDILTHLAQQGEPHTADLFSSEQAAHDTGEDQKYAFAAQAAIPNSATKAQYFADYQSTKIQEDWLTQSLRPFNSYNQQALTLPYLKQALDLLPQIKASRKIFFLGAWLSAFLDGQSTPEAQRIVDQWLAQPGQANLDPDLRRKVLENKDDLDRTVLIRKTFPD